MKFQVDIEAALTLLQKQGIEIQVANSSPETIATANQVLAAGLLEWTSLDEQGQTWKYMPSISNPYNAIIIQQMDRAGFILNHPTNEVYEQYVKCCEISGISPQYNKISFSKAVHKICDYQIKSVKRARKKYRLFVKDTL